MMAVRLDEEEGLSEISRRLGLPSEDAFQIFTGSFTQAVGFPFPVRPSKDNVWAEPFASEARKDTFARCRSG